MRIQGGIDHFLRIGKNLLFYFFYNPLRLFRTERTVNKVLLHIHYNEIPHALRAILVMNKVMLAFPLLLIIILIVFHLNASSVVLFHYAFSLRFFELIRYAFRAFLSPYITPLLFFQKASHSPLEYLHSRLGILRCTMGLQ